MSSDGAKSLILGRIRDAVGERLEPAAAAHARIERAYVQSGSLVAGAGLDLFVERLQHYQVAVHRCARAGIASTIATVLAARDKRGLLVPPDITREWLPAGVEFVDDLALPFRALDESEGVLTGCSFGIAATGTIVLRHGPGEGRRALTLVPDYHLCVVLAGQVVQTVPEAMRALAAAAPRLITTISGPSATADIEMTRIRGVHGPRTLDVILTFP